MIAVPVIPRQFVAVALELELTVTIVATKNRKSLHVCKAALIIFALNRGVSQQEVSEHELHA